MHGHKFITFLLFIAGVLAGSCGEKETVEESISVTPGTVQATEDLASYKLELSSNCSWTVGTEDENGEEVFWITPSRISGRDDAVVTLRVNGNVYNSVRKARVVFTTPGGKKAEVLVTQDGNENGESTPGELLLRLGTYNLRMHNLDTDADNSWNVRKERLKESITDCDFDVFGIQEVSSVMQTWLKDELSGRYSFMFFSPYSQGGSGDRAQGIVFRTSAFSTSDWHFFWASDTPDNMSTNDTGSSGSFSRGGCCCVLTHKQSGVKFFFMNTHACLNGEPNAAYAQVYIDQEKRFNVNGLPSFFVGDMNARPEYAAIATYKSYWQDSYDSAKSRSGATSSFNGYSALSGKYRIDYVFFRGNGITANDLCVSNKLYGGKYASDHFPVIVNFKISK